MISKTELKKRQKAREKEAAKAEKAAEKAAKEPKEPSAASKKNAELAEQDLTPNQVHKLRCLVHLKDVR
jgi:lysyl-tRNA synthetase class 2